MNGHWYVCHAAQTKLDYSTKRILDVSKRGSRKAEKEGKK